MTELAGGTFTSIDAVQAALEEQCYVADRSLATALFLSLRLRKPLLLEGEAGVGKTEVAKVLASMLHTRLIRLQGYEGIDVSHAVTSGTTPARSWQFGWPRPVVKDMS